MNEIFIENICDAFIDKYIKSFGNCYGFQIL